MHSNDQKYQLKEIDKTLFIQLATLAKDLTSCYSTCALVTLIKKNKKNQSNSLSSLGIGNILNEILKVHS